MRTPSPQRTKDKSFIDHSKTIKRISEDDYYKKNAEFRLWLLEHKGKYFDELEKGKQRKYFEKFVAKWNSNDLKDKFYEGLSLSQIPKADSTRYQWKFAKTIKKDEMDSVRDSVDSATNLYGKPIAQNQATRSARVIGPSFPSTDNNTSTFEDAVDQEDYLRQNRQRVKAENKMLRKRKESDLEELVPKETGREAMLEKRRAKGAHARRESSPDVELNDSELLGGDDFNSALARQKARDNMRNNRRQNLQLEKEAELKTRVEQHKAKEEATLDMFRKMAAAYQRPPPS